MQHRQRRREALGEARNELRRQRDVGDEDERLLGVVAEASREQVPIIGVNRGSLGFLTTFSADEIRSQFPALLQGDFKVHRRSLLECSACRGQHDLALNDVLIKDERQSRLVRLEVFADDELVTEYFCDGLIFSTPTGSTAYNLSAGGPLIHPDAGVIAMTPICPHTLTHRPIVVGADNVIEVVLNAANTINTQVTCDGQVSLPLERGDQIVIRKKERKVRLIHPINHDYFKLLRAKLRWGLSPEASSFV